ncbi:MAG: hypothetical protein R3B06_01735 [Kofleriaceae bacterium]
MTRLGAVALALALAAIACGGAPTPGPGPTTAPRNRATGTAPIERWRCPAGADLAVDLDGDGVVDRIRLAPAADAVSCLEVHPSTGPILLCGDAERRFLPMLGVHHGQAFERGVYRCDPQGATIRAVTPPPPPARPIDPTAIPTGRTFELVMLGEAAPTRTALWLDRGGGAAAITWHDGRWVWVDLGL